MNLDTQPIVIGDDEILNFSTDESADSFEASVLDVHLNEMFVPDAVFVDGTTNQVDVSLSKAQTTLIGWDRVVLQVTWIRNGQCENARVFLKGER